MMKLVFFLEEESAQEMLESVLPRLLASLPEENVCFHCVSFEGKQDLEKRLVQRLRGWQVPNCRFVVMRDQDSAKCEDVKQTLVDLCKQAGKPDALVRVVCRELESWYLGDLAAVEKGLGISGLAKLQGKEKFRNPDRLGNPKQVLRDLTKNSYQQTLGSSEIRKYLSLQGNRSHSFNVLISGIRNLLSGGNQP